MWTASHTQIDAKCILCSRRAASGAEAPCQLLPEFSAGSAVDRQPEHVSPPRASAGSALAAPPQLQPSIKSGFLCVLRPPRLGPAVPSLLPAVRRELPLGLQDSVQNTGCHGPFLAPPLPGCAHGSW